MEGDNIKQGGTQDGIQGGGSRDGIGGGSGDGISGGFNLIGAGSGDIQQDGWKEGTKGDINQGGFGR